MRHTLRDITILILLLLGVLAFAPAHAQQTDSAMVGAWSGRASFSVPFSAAHELAVNVTIAPDGAVSGTVGDAALVSARFGSGRGAMGRALRIGREFVIEGGLSGSLVHGEVVQRARVVISLDFRSGTFLGELQTSGTHDGAPDTQAIIASGLVLHRSAEVKART